MDYQRKIAVTGNNLNLVVLISKSELFKTGLRCYQCL